MIDVLGRLRLGMLLAVTGVLGGVLLWRLFGSAVQDLTDAVADSPTLSLPVAGEWIG